MKALIIDTSGESGVVALAEDGVILSVDKFTSGRGMSCKLFSSISSQCVPVPHFIAIGKGPGTFTGTRVGAMAAQMLAFGWSIPLIPFCSTQIGDLRQVAESTYEAFLRGEIVTQLQLVYISPKD